VAPLGGCSSGSSTPQPFTPTGDGSVTVEGGSDTSTSGSGDDSSLGTDSGTPAQGEAGVDATVFIDGGGGLVSPTTLDFGLVPCGGATPAGAQTFTITNPGTSSAAWTASLGKGTSSTFTLAPASGTLSAGQSAQVTVTPLAVPKVASTATGALGDLVNVTVGSSSVNVTLQETAQGAVLVFNPGSIPFGSDPVGNPLTTNFEVENVGNLGLSDVTLTLTGDPSFTLLDSTAVDAGESSTIEAADAGTSPRSTVAFTPSATGSVSGNIAVTVGASDVLCSPLPSPIGLSGTGTSGKVVVSPTSFVLTPDGVNQYVPCGEAALPVTVAIQNIGTAGFTWNATLQHGNGTFYTLSATSGSVNPMATTNLIVTPKLIPGTASTAANAFGDTLTITTSAPSDLPHTVTFNETAQGAIIARSINSLGFGNIGLGATNTQSYTFSNTGNMDAVLSFANGSGAFVENTPLTVGAGTFASESIAFTPTMLQTYSDLSLLSLQTNVPLCGALPGNFTLSGTGVNPTLTAVPSTLNFGSIPCGTAATSTQTFTVTNNGPATTFSAIMLKGAGSFFGVQPASGNLTAGGTAVLTVSGLTIPSTASTTTNGFSDTLQVMTGAGSVVDVTLNMTALGAVLGLSKANIAFGTTAPNTTVTSPLTVNNTGNYLTSVTVTAASMPVSPSVFGVTPGTGPVAGGQTMPITASFDPTPVTATSYTGTLSVTAPLDTPLCGPLPSIPLTGTAN
jgi:hypothetical protein